MDYQNTLQFARNQDDNDPLRHFRSQFHIPIIDGKEVIYFTGNSLGLQPKTAKDALLQELEDWKNWGVEGHFHAQNPWYAYHEFLQENSAKVVGAKPSEVVCMNGLTTNLHLLLVSFYRPTEKRFKILCEAKAFPSDQYTLESQVKFHGYSPEDAIVEIEPREGEHTINQEDILAKINELGDELALVMIGGVNYYSGQLFDMERITAAAHSVGSMVGFDLAHAAGNVALSLHDWGVDFAAWCSYKYMNSGPGSVSGIFVHEKHEFEPDIPRFSGWWGYDKETRFEMKKGFIPMKGAEGWQLSNAPVFSMAVHKASLDMFAEAGMDNLTEKSKKLTGYMEFILNDISEKNEGVNFEIITPKNPSERGAQLSVLIHGEGKPFFDKLTKEGVIADWREPNVIRMAPVPLYNSFEEVYEFGKILTQLL